MKSTFIYLSLILAICISVYFTYQRSFVTRDFEVINSEEEFEEEVPLVEEVKIEPESKPQEDIGDIEE